MASLAMAVPRGHRKLADKGFLKVFLKNLVSCVQRANFSELTQIKTHSSSLIQFHDLSQSPTIMPKLHTVRRSF